MSVAPNQPPDGDGSPNRAVAPRCGDRPPVFADESAHVAIPVDVDVLEAHGFDSGGSGRRAEQPHVARRRALDEQVGYDEPVALESGGESAGVRPKRLPAAAGVVVIVVAVARRGRARSGVSGAVAVRIEVEMGGELVAGACPGRAAHASGGRPVSEREGGAVLLPVGVGRRILDGVSVQIPADGVQLREGGYFDEAVVVQVVIAAYALIARVHAAVFKDGVIVRRPEIPRVVIARRAVDVRVPVGVNVRVGRYGLQLDGRLAFRHVGVAVVGDAARIQVPVRFGDGHRAAYVRQAGDVARDRGGGRAGGVAGDDSGGCVVFRRSNQAAHVGVGAGGGSGIRGGVGVAGDHVGDVAGGWSAVEVVSNQPADGELSANRAVAPGRGYGPAVGSDEGAHVVLSADVGVLEAYGFDARGAVDFAEQPDAVRGRALDEQVGYDEPVALERGGVGVGLGANRTPSAAGVVVSVAGVARGGRAGSGVGGAVVVGIEIEIGAQLVAGAVADRAAHPRVRGGSAVGEGVAVLRLRRAGRDCPVAVRVEVHGVQLRERADVDESVVVVVVIDGRLGVSGAGVSAAARHRRRERERRDKRRDEYAGRRGKNPRAPPHLSPSAGGGGGQKTNCFDKHIVRSLR